MNSIKIVIMKNVTIVMHDEVSLYNTILDYLAYEN